MSEETTKPNILTVGIEPKVLEALEKLLQNCEIWALDQAELHSLMERGIEPFPTMVFCGAELTRPAPTEAGQILSSVLQEVPLFFVSQERPQFEPAKLIKNGYTDVFILNIDRAPFERAVVEALVASRKEKTYRSVKVIDIQPGNTLDFDTHVYLPANNKHVRFSSAGDAVSPEKAAKLQKHQISSIHVTTDQLPKFYNYSAKRLKELNSTGNPMAVTERRERMQTAVRSLIGGILGDKDITGTIDEGRSMATDCQNIVSAYILDTPNGKLYQKVLAMAGDQGDTYSHTTNVSTYAALFSLGTGLGKPEDLAMAAMLHDIGLVDVAEEIQLKPEAERTAEEEAHYRKHVDTTIALLKNRKLILNDKVLKAIQQHHERVDGSGYPKAIDHPRVCVEAQILAIADQFDYLTCAKAGQARVSPLAALKSFTSPKYDPELVKKILQLFPGGAEAT